ncbi:MAG TPA: TetR/AcrR family transcriptional regulator [Acetobacteraceae bacterium]|nr:TetR/AcrR family transcriptional regulator [Acetobacteraceae bacterium]
MSGQDPKGARGYHHGNLREALIETALRLIAEHGPGGFAFSDVARAVGVSPAAPYRHFRDRNALVAEIARRGFERFAAELELAWGDGRPDPVTGLERCGRAYLDFARREPASFAAMFGADAARDTDPALRRAGDAAFAVLRRAAEAVCARRPSAPGRPPPLMVALHVWSMAHGVAALFVAAPEGGRMRLPMTPEDLLEAGLLVYLQSLGLVS